MIGKHVNVKDMTREQAFDYIMNKCKNCEISLFCNGMDSELCNAKVAYLLKKFKGAEGNKSC